MKRIYLDSSVVLSLAFKDRFDNARARKLAEQADEVITSQLTFLEVVAPLVAAKKTSALARAQSLLDLTTLYVPVSEALVASAIKLASRKYGFSAADAIHLAVCQEHDAVFLNAERPGNAPNTVEGVESHTIYLEKA